MENHAKKPLIRIMPKNQRASAIIVSLLVISLLIVLFVMASALISINSENSKTKEKISIISENPQQTITEKITIAPKDETKITESHKDKNNNGLTIAENQEGNNYNDNTNSEATKEKTNSFSNFFGRETNMFNSLCPAEMKGSGTTEDPCMITNWAQLQAINEKLNFHYALANNLNGALMTDNPTDYTNRNSNPLFIFSLLNKIKFGKGIGLVSASSENENSFIPIGTLSTPFTGVFDGKGYTIKNLYINSPDSNYVGLFGINEGEIRNVKLTNVEIIGGNYVGGLAGQNLGIIENSSSIGNVNGFVDFEIPDAYGNYVGGLTGINGGHGKIKNSHVRGNVNGMNYVGGAVGGSTTYSILGPTASITESSFEGNVKGYSSVGGFVGINSAGGAKPSPSIRSSYAKGIVEGSQYVGGFVGKNNFGYITDSYFIGEVKGNNTDESVGGFAGFNAETNPPQNQQQEKFIKNSYVVANENQKIKFKKIKKTNCFAGATSYNTGNSISNSFWNSQKCSGIGRGGQGKTTTEMFDISTYTDAGWDFANTWKIADSVNSEFAVNSYPCFQWQEDSTCTFASLNDIFLQIQFVSPTPQDNSILSQNFINANVIANGDDLDTITIYLHNSDGLLNSTSAKKNQLSFEFANLADGAYYLNATASDGFGNTKQTETRKIILINYNCHSGMAGDGTSANPCQILNWTQLQAMNEELSFYYILINNLNSSTPGFSDYQAGEGFAPIGDDLNKFKGNFNGNGFSINKLYINNSSADYVGLFGINDGTIANVNLINSNIKGNNAVGALSGENSKNGIIINSHSSGNVFGSGDRVGGLVGHNNEGGISDSNSDAKADGNNSVGGLVGENNGNIFDSHATGDVNGGDSHMGGLVGWNYIGSIYNSYSTGNVAGTRETGGLVGVNEKNIYNSYATGNVNGTSTLGGLTGINIGEIYNSYATGNANGDYYIGGAVGLNWGGNIYDSYATGNTNGNVFGAGGLVGDNRGNILNSYSIGSVSGTTFVGGLVGINFANCTTSFWDTQSSGQSASACGEGKTTSEMKTKTTFTGAGWDFINIWDIDDINQIINNGYPFLR